MPRNPSKVDYSQGFPDGFESFWVLEGPRSGGNTKHHFGEIIFIAVSALVSGAQSFCGIVEFAHLHEDWLRKWVSLPHGVPVVQTFINTFSMIDPTQFGQCIIQHLKTLHPELANQLIAIDGKTLRGSAKSKEEQVHCLSAWASDAGLTLALEFVKKKSNEIPAIPLLLDQIDIDGQVVSFDAMGTQTAIASKIINKGGDYLMALKRNQSALHNEVIDQFHFAKRQIERENSDSWCLHEEVEKSNGRICKRKIAVTDDLDWMVPSIRKRWKELKSLIAIETQTHHVSSGKIVTQTRFYISSLKASGEEFQGLIRKHWGIENGCHWVLDTLYREDHAQIRVERAAKNFSILRRIALNLIKLDTSSKKSLPMKQMRLMVDETYREHILSLAG